MAEDGKTNTEGGSFADAPQEETKPHVPIKPEETVFTYLKDIIKAIEAKEAQLAHHLDRIATALETLVKREQINRAPTGIPAPTPVAPVVKPSIPTPIPAPVPTSIPTPTPVSTPTSSFMDSIKAAFPKELADMLVFEDKGNMVTIKPRQYLGSENFAKIASIVRSLNGEYVSAGKDSHFRVVPKK